MYAASGGSTYGGSIEHGVEFFIKRFTEGDDSADIQTGLNAQYAAEENPGWIVADVTGTFELRKLQVRISRAPAGRIEDVDVMTFHFLKTVSGTPSNDWSSGTEYSAVETAFNAMWTTDKTDYPSFMHLDQYRWYKDGPDFWELNTAGTAYVPKGDNAAVRVTEVDVAGTSSATAVLPPQVAWSLTEITSKRRSWGRFYLPAGDANRLDNTGLLGATELGSTLGAAVTFYNACRTATAIPVVFSIQKPERPKAGGGTLDAVGATAYEVTSLQMDDICDVIRSRRYQNGVTKTRTALT
jgi:hypothetical protein